MNSVFILNFKEPYDQNYAIFLHLSGDGKLIWSDFSMRFFFKLLNYSWKLQDMNLF